MEIKDFEEATIEWILARMSKEEFETLQTFVNKRETKEDLEEFEKGIWAIYFQKLRTLPHKKD